jgi:hypothetical protein
MRCKTNQTPGCVCEMQLFFWTSFATVNVGYIASHLLYESEVIDWSHRDVSSIAYSFNSVHFEKCLVDWTKYLVDDIWLQWPNIWFTQEMYGA